MPLRRLFAHLPRYQLAWLLLALSSLLSGPLLADNQPQEQSGAEAALPAFGDWAASLAIAPGVIDELTRFSYRDQALASGYARTLAQNIRQQVISDSISRLTELAPSSQSGQSDQSAQPAEPAQVDVSYPEPGFAMPGTYLAIPKVAQKFEQGFIRTEVVAHLDVDGVSASDALEAYTRPEFRLSSSSQLEAVTGQQGLTCYQTRKIAVVLEPTFSCNQVHYFHQPGISAQHAQMVSNPGSDEFHPVYFKESLKIFIETPAGLALYYINYTRATDLGSFKKKVGHSKIVKSQHNSLNALQQILTHGQ